MRGGTLSRLVEIQRLLRQVLIKVQIAADGEHGAAWDRLNCLKAQIDAGLKQAVEIGAAAADDLRESMPEAQIGIEIPLVFEEDDAA